MKCVGYENIFGFHTMSCDLPQNFRSNHYVAPTHFILKRRVVHYVTGSSFEPLGNGKKFEL